ncbi:hypothetical protein [Tahibacter sp.]|uniref:hypothetical protein n=1 Tax=Tahibacter sp. TaxID=2056211 RepID=UPI0028C4F7CB|nr:hypothetical protein [Tahibacter sp.]
MKTSAPALLTRLRRHLVVLSWVFAILALSRAGFSSACFTDGVVAPETAKAVLVAVDPDGGTDFRDGAGVCWHGRSAGCHCSCFHICAIAPELPLLSAKAITEEDFAPVPAPPLLVSRDDHLRPPIA